MTRQQNDTSILAIHPDSEVDSRYLQSSLAQAQDWCLHWRVKISEKSYHTKKLTCLPVKINDDKFPKGGEIV